jgi:ssDNA-binding replication factor A large subunit
MGDNYDSLLDRICRASGVAKDEVERRVEAKRAKLSGLISKEGAAQIVAAELGVSFENEQLKLSELVQGMRKANVVGKITRVFPIREYKKNGREGRVANFLLGDETSNVRVVLWDENHIKLIADGKIKEGDVVQISSGGVRNGELHLSGFSDIVKSKEKLAKVKEAQEFAEVRLKDLQVGNNVKTRAVIVQTFEPKYFNDKESGEKRALLNLVLDDGTETVRAVMFGKTINSLGLGDNEVFDLEKFNGRKMDILGEEKFFVGSVRMNAFFNRIEFSVNSVESVNADELLKKLESVKQ